ncbi:MAG TPA: PKD domain-containing protein, partial [Gemmatimonadaceae bacterium]
GITVSPSGLGVRDASVYRFALAGTDRAPSTVVWDFGDGVTATGDSVEHVFRRDGISRVSARFSGPGGSGVSGADVAVGSLDGLWFRRSTNGIDFWLSVVQTGGTLTGEYIVAYTPSHPSYAGSNAFNTSALTGSVSDRRVVSVIQNGECLRVMDQASVSADLNTITGVSVNGNRACDVNGVTSFTTFFDRVPAPGIRSVTVAPASRQVAVGATVNFSATIDGGTNRTIGWGSSNINVASIAGDGVVLGVRPGTATITVWAFADPTKRATVTVTVTAAAPPD